MQAVKVVLIGAGSNSFGPGTINSLLAAPDLLAHRALRLVLVDTSETALERMNRYAEAIRAFRGVDATLEATTDRTKALPGADFVVTAVSVRRYELWREDFLIPLAYGFRHPYGECGGPGAAFHTLRSLHLVVPVARDMERLCPEAWLLNFTNPESRVCQGVSGLTRVRSAGLCHGFHSTYQAVAGVLGRPAESLELDLGGINHFHWVLGIRDRVSGEDLRPEFDRLMAQGKGDLGPLTRFLYDTFGRLPFPSDDHIAEYLRFGYEFVGPHYLGYEARVQAGAAAENSQARVVSGVADGSRPVTEDLARPSGELVAPLITDLALDTGLRRESVNVLNTGPAIPNLPGDAVVEVPATADAAGLHPVSVGPLPEPLAALCRTQIAIQKLLVEAYATGSKQALLQALLLEPTVDDTGRCREMMAEMLRRQAAYLPELA